MARRPDPAPATAPDATDTLTIDPFADLLFALIASVLPMILLLVATAHPPQPAASGPPRSSQADAAAPAVVVAGRSGLRWAGHAAVDPDHIPDDPDLRALLRRAAGNDAGLLEMIEPDGLESAFVFEPVMAASGSGTMKQIRLTEPCDRVRDSALRGLCGAASTAATP